MTHEIHRGHKILISNENAAPDTGTPPASPDNAEVLTINGKHVPFAKTDAGYQIYYQPPAPSLIEAARGFVETQREIVE